MNKQPADYSRLGQWISEIPLRCANPTAPHRLHPNRMINGWAECRCGGHRTVRCLAYDGDHPCNAVHYLPARRPACNCADARIALAAG